MTTPQDSSSSSASALGSVASLSEQVAARARRDADSDKLVLLRLEASSVAEEEQSFARVCSDFLERAQERHQHLVQRGKAAEANIHALATFLGEAADSDAAHIFGLIWAFVLGFDSAFVKVARAIL